MIANRFYDKIRKCESTYISMGNARTKLPRKVLLGRTYGGRTHFQLLCFGQGCLVMNNIQKVPRVFYVLLRLWQVKSKAHPSTGYKKYDFYICRRDAIFLHSITLD